MPNLSPESAKAFSDQFRAARLAALADAEAFDGIIHVVERLGSYLTKERLGDKGDHGGLHEYKDELCEFAKMSSANCPNRGDRKHLLTPFETLFKLVKDGRNDALHQGAFARHLTKHAIELAIILEDALSTEMNPIVMDFLVQNPVCGELWQPVAFVRQQMLANSFSYIPVLVSANDWRVVSDAGIARFLGGSRGGKPRTRLLSKTVEEAFDASQKPLGFAPAISVAATATLESALELLEKSSILVVPNPSGTGLLGILTAFDLL
jgi:hypothetical protein